VEDDERELEIGDDEDEDMCFVDEMAFVLLSCSMAWKIEGERKMVLKKGENEEGGAWVEAESKEAFRWPSEEVFDKEEKRKKEGSSSNKREELETTNSTDVENSSLSIAREKEEEREDEEWEREGRRRNCDERAEGRDEWEISTSLFEKTNGNGGEERGASEMAELITAAGGSNRVCSKLVCGHLERNGEVSGEVEGEHVWECEGECESDRENVESWGGENGGNMWGKGEEDSWSWLSDV